MASGAGYSHFDSLTPPYRTIVADPPWQYRVTTEKRTTASTRTWPEEHYRTMTMREIAALPVGDLAAGDAHLYLWVTNPRLDGDRTDRTTNPFDIVRAWGFTYKTLLTWVKPMGTGSYFRGCTEHVIFAVRGTLAIPPMIREPNVVKAPRTTHSSKPPAFYDVVERVSEPRRVELFARSPRLGWDSWGYGYETVKA